MHMHTKGQNIKWCTYK